VARAGDATIGFRKVDRRRVRSAAEAPSGRWRPASSSEVVDAYRDMGEVIESGDRSEGSWFVGESMLLPFTVVGVRISSLRCDGGGKVHGLEPVAEEAEAS
jgi:hypothetical protein